MRCERRARICHHGHVKLRRCGRSESVVGDRSMTNYSDVEQHTSRSSSATLSRRTRNLSTLCGSRHLIYPLWRSGNTSLGLKPPPPLLRRKGGKPGDRGELQVVRTDTTPAMPILRDPPYTNKSTRRFSLDSDSSSHLRRHGTDSSFSASPGSSHSRRLYHRQLDRWGSHFRLLRGMMGPEE